MAGMGPHALLVMNVVWWALHHTEWVNVGVEGGGPKLLYEPLLEMWKVLLKRLEWHGGRFSWNVAASATHNPPPPGD